MFPDEWTGRRIEATRVKCFEEEKLIQTLDLFSLYGRKALVTGGSTGLGEQIALALTELGAETVICSRNVENCRTVAEKLERQTGSRTHALQLDVTNYDSVQKTVHSAVSIMGGIDILVNNAGIAWGAPAVEMPLAKWDSVMQVNATGTFLVSQAVGKGMITQGYGRIINIASICGLYGFQSDVLEAVGYSASKGAVITLTRDLAVKWAPCGITVNAIAPGFFPSKLSRGVIDHGADRLLAATPLARFGGEDDLKGIVAYLASAASSYMTGQVLSIDGGASAM